MVSLLLRGFLLSNRQLFFLIIVIFIAHFEYSFGLFLVSINIIIIRSRFMRLFMSINCADFLSSRLITRLKIQLFSCGHHIAGKLLWFGLSRWLLFHPSLRERFVDCLLIPYWERIDWLFLFMHIGHPISIFPMRNCLFLLIGCIIRYELSDNLFRNLMALQFGEVDSHS